MSPRTLPGQEYEGPAVDIWSLGVTQYRMVAGTLPFKGMNWKQLGQQVLRGKYTVPFFLSFEVENLLKKMLGVKPQERANLIAIMADSWLNMGEEDHLRPYSEPPSDNIDPWVKREMINLGFH